MKKNINMILGLIFIVVGIIFALNAFNITNINIFFNGWWTLFIIVPNLVSLIQGKDRLSSIFWLIIGLLLLIISNEIIPLDLLWKLLIPMILIFIGLSFLSKEFYSNKIKKDINLLKKNKKNIDNGFEHWATFSETKVNAEEKDFKNVTLNAIFGSMKYDLSKSNLKNDAIIDAYAIFGGIEIIVPKDVVVKIIPTSIFGGTEDKTINRESTNGKILYINSTCVFGGVSIK